FDPHAGSAGHGGGRALRAGTLAVLGPHEALEQAPHLRTSRVEGVRVEADAPRDLRYAFGEGDVPLDRALEHGPRDGTPPDDVVATGTGVAVAPRVEQEAEPRARAHLDEGEGLGLDPGERRQQEGAPPDLVGL